MNETADSRDYPPWRVEAEAVLVILSHEVAPDSLVEAVGLKPDRAWAKGEPKRMLENRPRPSTSQPFNGVWYESGLPRERQVEEHVEALVERLRPHADGIRTIVGWPTTMSVRFRVVEFRPEDNHGFELRPDLLVAIAEMGAVFSTYTYYFSDDYDEDAASGAG